MIDMNETRVCALGQLKAFLEGTGEIRFQSVGDDEGRYSHIQAVLKRFAYPRLKRADKGLVLRYLGRTTGYSRQQLTRLVRQCLATGGLAKRYHPPAQGFARKYTGADVALLAETDALHDTLSGPATKHLMQRACWSSGTPAMRGWRSSRWRISTTCGPPPATGRAANTGPRRVPPVSRSGSAARRNRTGTPATCASTASTRAMRMG